MATKMMLVGADKVVAALQAESLSGNSFFRIHVGYRAPYAVYVHENLRANHPNGGQAKFLEQPARQLRGAMKQLVKDNLKRKKKSLEAGCLAAGNMLLEASQKLVPVDTGYLRSTGFVELR
jgi:hypothetical protein